MQSKGSVSVFFYHKGWNGRNDPDRPDMRRKDLRGQGLIPCPAYTSLCCSASYLA